MDSVVISKTVLSAEHLPISPGVLLPFLHGVLGAQGLLRSSTIQCGMSFRHLSQHLLRRTACVFLTCFYTVLHYALLLVYPSQLLRSTAIAPPQHLKDNITVDVPTLHPTSPGLYALQMCSVYSDLPTIGYILKRTYQQHDEPLFRFLSQIQDIVNSSPYSSTQWEKSSDLAFAPNKIKLFKGLGLEKPVWLLLEKLALRRFLTTGDKRLAVLLSAREVDRILKLVSRHS
jgi:hypothetical protein